MNILEGGFDNSVMHQQRKDALFLQIMLRQLVLHMENDKLDAYLTLKNKFQVNSIPICRKQNIATFIRKYVKASLGHQCRERKQQKQQDRQRYPCKVERKSIV